MRWVPACVRMLTSGPRGGGLMRTSVTRASVSSSLASISGERTACVCPAWSTPNVCATSTSQPALCPPGGEDSMVRTAWVSGTTRGWIHRKLCNSVKRFYHDGRRVSHSMVRCATIRIKRAEKKQPGTEAEQPCVAEYIISVLVKQEGGMANLSIHHH